MLNGKYKYLWIIPVALAFLVHFQVIYFDRVSDDLELFKTWLPNFQNFHDIWFFKRDQLGQGSFYYRPIFYVSLMLSRMISGEALWSYHLMLLLYHTINTGLVYRLARHFFPDTSSEQSAAPLLASLFFAVYPMHLEVISWISATLEALMTLFFLVALIHFLKFRTEQKTGSIFWMTLALILSFLSKETSFAILPILFLYDRFFASLPEASQKYSKLPYLAVAIAGSVYGVLHYCNHPQNPVQSLEMPFGEWPRQMFLAFGYYLKAALIPFSNIPYLIELPHDFLAYTLSLLLVSLFFFWGYRSWKKRSDHFLFLALFFFPLLPAVVISVIKTSGLPAADRYLYLPSVGLALVFGQIFGNVSKRSLSTWMALFLILLFSLVSHQNARFWKNQQTFWTRTSQLFPENYVPWSNLGRLAFERGDYNEALRLIDRGFLFLDDENLFALAGIYLNKGAVLYNSGRIEESIPFFDKSIKILPKWKAYLNLGIVFLGKANSEKEPSTKKKYLETAESNLKASLQLQPRKKKILEYLEEIRKQLHKTE